VRVSSYREQVSLRSMRSEAASIRTASSPRPNSTAHPSVTSTMEDGSKAADPEWLCVHPQLDEVMVRTDIE
jgi:hypothetical protein